MKWILLALGVAALLIGGLLVAASWMGSKLNRS